MNRRVADLGAKNLHSFSHIAQTAAKKGAQVLMEHLGRVQVREKAPRDLVTEADMRSQETIARILRAAFPDHQLMGEESPQSIDWRSGFCWIIDPLDGTTNYVHQLPSFSVSIALFHQGWPIVGVVFDPWLGEMYAAIAGNKAECNGNRIQPSRCTSLRQSLLVCSFPSVVDDECLELKRFNRVVKRATMRRLGSAALNLCYVGCGRLDGYWASTLKIWDIAAGVLIAQESGAHVQEIERETWDWSNLGLIAASTKELAVELTPLLRE